MTLRKEYQAIMDSARTTFDCTPMELDLAQWVAERCQALADKPPKLLMDQEIERVVYDTRGGSMGDTCRAIIAAHIAKQKEPETRKVKIALYKLENGKIISATEDEGIHDRAIVLEEFEHEVTL